jgi:hypothetical protein
LTVPEPPHYRERRVKRLDTMCTAIQRVLDTDGARARLAAENLAPARALANRFVLTHRTTSGARLEDILSERRLQAKHPCTDREVECGLDLALYFFLGCAAYPEGNVAFLVKSHLLERIPASYSPFDSGSLTKRAHLRDPQAPWGEPEKLAFLQAHLGDGTDAIAFCAEYMAAHFEAAADYVLRPQESEPDFPTYHDLVSKTGDRRAWSVEVRLHEDLELDAEHIAAIVVAREDLLDSLPDDLLGRAVVAEDAEAITSTIQRLILEEELS